MLIAFQAFDVIEYADFVGGKTVLFQWPTCYCGAFSPLLKHVSDVTN